MAGARASRPPRPPGLRLLVQGGRLVRARPLVRVAGLLARCGVLHGYALWPAVEEPLIGVDLGHPPAAAWLRSTFEADSRAPASVSAATWNALRARGLVIGKPSWLAIAAAERGLGRALRRPRLCTYSPTGKGLSKITCFVFERQASSPSVVVKAMPERRHGERLYHETEVVEALRARLSDAVALTLPLRPLWAGNLGGDYIVVQPLDPLAAWTGRATRRGALGWLHAFQTETTGRTERWGAADAGAALEHVGYAWSRARPASEPAVSARVGQLLESVEGRPVPRCAVHGDFWRGQVADGGESLRVYDWEWAQLEGDPFMDLWTYELAELRQRLERESLDPAPLLLQALEHVRGELHDRGLDSGFALATAAPALSRLAFRVRRATGQAGGGEDSSAKLMAALERLILEPGGAGVSLASAAS